MRGFTYRRLWLVLATIVVLLVLLGAVLSPEVAARWVSQISPGCVFRRVTGLSCPGCGGTRALLAFLRGDWAAAWQYNMLLWVSLLLLAEEYVRLLWAELNGSERWSDSRWYPLLLRGYAAVVVLWMIGRNIWGV